MRRVATTWSVFRGQSLLKGLDLLSSLTAVFLQFREDNIALSADFEHLFMKVKVTAEDRKFLRFLWINDSRVDTNEYTSHIIGPTDSPCIEPNALKITIRDKCVPFPDVIKYIERHVNMDDLYVATDSVEKAQRILSEMRPTLSRGFNLTKWNSNSWVPWICRAWHKIGNIKSSASKSEGTWFTMESNHWLLPDQNQAAPKNQIKWGHNSEKLLRSVASVFDELGFIAPLTIRLRKILQAAWSQGPKWDKPLVQNFPDFFSLTEEISNQSGQFNVIRSRVCSVSRLLYQGWVLRSVPPAEKDDYSKFRDASSCVRYTTCAIC